MRVRAAILMTWGAWSLAVFCGLSTAWAVEPPTEAAVRDAVVKSLPLLEKGALGSLEQRAQCFTCHNQGQAIMALAVAQQRGIKIDEEHLQKQVDFTAKFLKRNKTNYLAGKGQGGQVDTAGYALWALNNGGWTADETTAAVAEYFLQYQADQKYYEPSSRRPPSEQSHFTSTYVALRALKVFGTPEQQERIAARIEQIKAWLAKAEPEDTEDRVFRLRVLHLIDAGAEAVAAARQELLMLQRADGGWAQLPDLESDAYATGTALVALHDTGLATTDPAYQQGLAYLISTQQEDGSWHVVTRSKPFQLYFESGYPHGKDQFISMSAAGWSTTALALSLPVVKPVTQPAAEADATSEK